MLALVRKFENKNLIKNIILIIDDDDCIGYLNDWDKKISHLDVVDDYRNEKKEIQARQGKQFPFSFGDVNKREFLFFFPFNLFIFVKYVVKILMGGVDSWFDDLDEKKVMTDNYGRMITSPDGQKRKKSRCIIL